MDIKENDYKILYVLLPMQNISVCVTIITSVSVYNVDNSNSFVLVFKPENKSQKSILNLRVITFFNDENRFFF